jgi:type I restriction enzyme, S subunit
MKEAGVGNWKQVKLANCARIVSGATPKTSEPRFWDGNINWVTPKDVSDLAGFQFLDSTPRTLTADGLASCSAEMLPPGSVLLSSRAPIGLVAINRIPVATNQGFKSFVPDTTCLDAGFLYHWLRANRAFLERLGTGATFKEISKAVVSEIEIFLPPLDEQKRIAAVLDKSLALCRYRQEAFQLTEVLLQAHFLKMFGDPLTNPKRWPVVSMDEICSRIVDCPHTTPRWTDSGYICLRTSNLGKGRFIWDDTRYVDERQHVERTARLPLEPGDIILSREGTVGIAAIVPDGPAMSLGQRLVQLRPDRRKTLSQFLLGLVLWVLDPRRLSRVMVGATSKHLNVKELREMKVILPPLELQTEFETTAAKISQLIEDNLLQAGTAGARLKDAGSMNSLFLSLQQRAFRGELNLSRLILNSSYEAPAAPEPTKTAEAVEPGSAAGFLQAPEETETALKELDVNLRQDGPMAWSADYFRYRILGTMPIPFSFDEVMQRADGVFSEEPPYEVVKEMFLELLSQGEPAILRQRFDLQIHAETNEVSGRKEIVFEPNA